MCTEIKWNKYDSKFVMGNIYDTKRLYYWTVNAK